MRNDLELITRVYPHEQNVLRVYAIGDVHVGSPEFDEKAIKKKLQIIADDPCATLVLCGDLGDFGLKNSKSNVYLATMQPKEQIEYIYHLFKPVEHKISACVPGNHEERITRDVGLSVFCHVANILAYAYAQQQKNPCHRYSLKTSYACCVLIHAWLHQKTHSVVSYL